MFFETIPCALLLAAALTTAPPLSADAPPAGHAAPAAARTDTLTFDEALARATAYDPVLRAGPLRTDAARAAVAQANARPNPGLALEAENVGGSYHAFERSELSIYITQELELGGRRGARRAAAAHSQRLVEFDARADTLGLYAETRRRYTAAVHAEMRCRIAREAVAIVDELVAAADAGVTAGATPVSDRALATAARASARLAVERADSERRGARQALASLWGESTFDAPVAAALDGPSEVPSAQWVFDHVDDSPAVVRARIGAESLRADTGVERSLRVPPLSVTVGARRIEADDAGTFIVGLAMPLPLWDRRGEAVHAADARARAADLTTARIRTDVAGALAVHVETLARLTAHVRHVDAQVIPELRAAADGLRAAYRMGRSSYPDLLEVERTLITIEQEQNDARRAIAEEVIAIEELTGVTTREWNHE
ncbi:MAG TPA: TolC family protein [Candidatus Krumholzibacteria bacterium]|nr:TolC family protein [Candidatus Krumholzibacteria bacterium]